MYLYACLVGAYRFVIKMGGKGGFTGPSSHMVGGGSRWTVVPLISRLADLLPGSDSLFCINNMRLVGFIHNGAINSETVVRGQQIVLQVQVFTVMYLLFGGRPRSL